MSAIRFDGGPNIAIKIPKSKYLETVAFYRDILKMETEEQQINHPTISKTHKVTFGNNTLWLDCVDNYTHSETWLELRTQDTLSAATYLKSKGIDTCDEIEEIPKDKHWIMDPAGTVFILDGEENNDG